MSRLNPPEDDAPTLTPTSTDLERWLAGSLTRIVNPRRRRALHPQTVHDLLVEKARRRKPVYPQFGWVLGFWHADGRRTFLDVIKVPDANGGRRHASYADVVEVRDELMAMYGYEKCWLRMRTAEDVRKRA